MNHVADPSTNVVDQSVDSSASKTLTSEVNIETATTEAAASTTLDVSTSVPEPGNTATTEDSVSTTEAAAPPIFPSDHLAAEKGKSGSIVIGLKTKIGNPGYTTMQKKKQLFVLLA